MTTRKRFGILSLTMLILLLVSGGLLAEELDVTFNQVEFSQIFRVLGESQGLNVLVDPSVTGQGSFHLQGVSFKGALDLLAQHSGYPYRIEGNTLLVGTPEDKEVRYLTIKNVAATDVLEALQLVMPRSDIYVQPQGGLVILSGTKSVLDRAEELIRALDSSIPTQEASPQAQGSSLLGIFKALSAELGLNLVADPSLEDRYLYIDVRNQNPEELIRQIQLLVPLQVEMTEHSLVVTSRDQSLERLKVYRLNYAEPQATQVALSMLIDPAKIQLDEDRKSLTVRGTDLELAEVDRFLADFDQPAPQVVLEVWVQETSIEGMRELGIDLKGTPSFLGGGDAPVFIELQWEPWELILALRAMENKGDSKVLANPQIATLNGKEASIFVGDRVPIVLTGAEGERTLQFLESGINLKVTPRIADDDYITILVQPEVSTFIYRSEIDYPTIRTREAETTVRVKNGQPFVLGGLLQEQENETIRQIPFLSQLPVLGKLFQWKETKKNSTEMTIFVIPRLVEDGQAVVRQDFFTQTQ